MTRTALRTRCLAYVVFATVAPAVQASLFLNASFEDVPNSDNGQGLLPTAWLDSTNTFPGADTYSENDDYGLTAGSFNHFNSPFAPYDGERWLAGGAFATGEREGISQLLPLALTPGERYTFDAAVTHTTLFGGGVGASGGWELMLSPDTTFTNPLAASLGVLPSNQLDVWQLRSLTFRAPANAASLPYLLLVPYTDEPGLRLAYVAIDGPVSIDPADGTVPEWSSSVCWSLLSLGGAIRFRRRRSATRSAVN